MLAGQGQAHFVSLTLILTPTGAAENVKVLPWEHRQLCTFYLCRKYIWYFGILLKVSGCFKYYLYFSVSPRITHLFKEYCFFSLYFLPYHFCAVCSFVSQMLMRQFLNVMWLVNLGHVQIFNGKNKNIIVFNACTLAISYRLLHVHPTQHYQVCNLCSSWNYPNLLYWDAAWFSAGEGVWDCGLEHRYK